VVGFDDIALAELTEPPLTTVRLPRRELPGKAFEARIDRTRIDGKSQRLSGLGKSMLRVNATTRQI